MDMNEDIQKKMQTLIYALTKNAARFSYLEFLEDYGITMEDYAEIKKVWEEKLGVKPYV